MKSVQTMLRSRLGLGVLLGVFLGTRLVSLVKLPVFADEAIYIRWAQLAVNETGKYLFLPMLDGKPPLHAWLIVPFLQIFDDPLIGGRMLSVLAGLATLFLVDRLVVLLGGRKTERLLAYVFLLVLPYWHFHQRMALAESLLVMFLSLAFYGGMKYLNQSKKSGLVWLTLGVAGSLWVKTSAFFFIPMLGLLPLLKVKMKGESVIGNYLSEKTFKMAWAGLVGVIIFLLLKFSPLFPQLFSRSLDYTFTSKELLTGEWRHVVLISLPRTLGWILRYMSPLVLVVLVSGQRRVKVLVSMALLYMLPVWIYGRVLSPRYFFPMVLPLTLAMVFAISGFLKEQKYKIWAKASLGLACVYSTYFMYFSMVDPAKIPFAEVDKIQYLTEWSSGYGIPQVRDFIAEKIMTNKVSVKTEGTFGTLPDGLLMYFDKSSDIDNLNLSGTEGSYAKALEELAQVAKDRQAYLVVNEHRLGIDILPVNVEVLASYPRPLDGPALLLLKVNPIY